MDLGPAEVDLHCEDSRVESPDHSDLPFAFGTGSVPYEEMRTNAQRKRQRKQKRAIFYGVNQGIQLCNNAWYASTYWHLYEQAAERYNSSSLMSLPHSCLVRICEFVCLDLVEHIEDHTQTWVYVPMARKIPLLAFRGRQVASDTVLIAEEKSSTVVIETEEVVEQLVSCVRPVPDSNLQDDFALLIDAVSTCQQELQEWLDSRPPCSVFLLNGLMTDCSTEQLEIIENVTPLWPVVARNIYAVRRSQADVDTMQTIWLQLIRSGRQGVFLDYIIAHEGNSQFMQVFQPLLARIYAEDPSREDCMLGLFWEAFLTEDEMDEFQEIWYFISDEDERHGDRHFTL